MDGSQSPFALSPNGVVKYRDLEKAVRYEV